MLHPGGEADGQSRRQEARPPVEIDGAKDPARPVANPRVGQLHDRLEASLKQSARVAASDGALHASLDANAYANAVMAFVVGRWHQFAKSGFKRPPTENLAQSWRVFSE